MTEFEKICEEARACKICEPHLPFGANPVFAAGENAKRLVVGQAPGAKVHQTGIPFQRPQSFSASDFFMKSLF